MNRNTKVLFIRSDACNYFWFIDRTFRNWSISKLMFFPLPIAWAIFSLTYILMHFSLIFPFDWMENTFGTNIEAERNEPFTNVTILIWWTLFKWRFFIDLYFLRFEFYSSIALMHSAWYQSPSEHWLFCSLFYQMKFQIDWNTVSSFKWYGFCEVNFVIHSAIVSMSKIDWIIEFCTLNLLRLYCKGQCPWDQIEKIYFWNEFDAEFLFVTCS